MYIVMIIMITMIRLEIRTYKFVNNNAFELMIQNE